MAKSRHIWSLCLQILFYKNKDSTVSEFIETDPNNPKGTRDTEKGKELFNEIENILNESE